MQMRLIIICMCLAVLFIQALLFTCNMCTPCENFSRYSWPPFSPLVWPGDKLLTGLVASFSLLWKIIPFRLTFEWFLFVFWSVFAWVWFLVTQCCDTRLVSVWASAYNGVNWLFVEMSSWCILAIKLEWQKNKKRQKLWTRANGGIEFARRYTTGMENPWIIPPICRFPNISPLTEFVWRFICRALEFP